MNRQRLKITGKVIWQAIFFILAVSITVKFIPREKQFRYHFEEGKPWRYGLLTAPFDFPIYKSDIKVNAEKDSIMQAFSPFYERKENFEKSRIDEFLKNNQSENPDTANLNRMTADILEDIYKKGIMLANEYDELIRDNKQSIRLIKNSVAESYSVENILTPRMAYEELFKRGDNTDLEEYLRGRNMNLYLEPNLAYDTIMNNRMLGDMLDGVETTSGMVQAGERIIDKGVIVSPEIYQVLKSYEKKAFKNENKIDTEEYNLIGEALIVTILYSFLYLFLALFRRRIFNNIRQLSLLMIMVLAVTLLTYLISQRLLLGAYMVPLAILPIIVVTFMDTRTALYASIVAIMLSCSASPFPLEYVLLQIIVCMTAIDSLKELTKRSEMFRSVILIFVAYSLTYVAYILMTEGSIQKINENMFLYFGINCFILLFSYLLVYIIEKVWGFTSNVMLVELSDLNSPLLKELSEKCPGTFQHATQVANLAAEAANAIGANAILVRTGALYHDIGKSKNPTFYTENQHNINPHSTLSYVDSAKIIISHVENGLALAKKHHLPESIKGFISTHHGLSKAKYFYTMYKNEHPNEEIDETLFSYSGPKPRTKEEGILMMADIIEAKSRSLKEFSHETLSNIVNGTIDEIIAEGQLANTPLTFRDVTEIRKVLIERLEAIYHPRISYPEIIK